MWKMHVVAVGHGLNDKEPLRFPPLATIDKHEQWLLNKLGEML